MRHQAIITIVISTFVLSLVTGCAASLTSRKEPRYEKMVDHNVLSAEEVFNPATVAQKSGAYYVVIKSQSDLLKLSAKNAVYCIKAEINLQGRTLTIPQGCLLYFDGGSLCNGTIRGNNTLVVARDYEIFKHGTRTYRAYIADSYKYMTSDKNAIVIEGTWRNENCGTKWTGMLSGDTKHCASLAINNYIKLHKAGQEITFPRNAVFYVYDRIICDGHSMDFNGSTIKSIDFSIVEDNTIALPSGTKPRALKSLYGLVAFNADDAYIKNLTIDGCAGTRSETPSLGTECLLSMASNKNCQLQNVTIKDAVGCGICTYSISNCTFENVTIVGCGEHGIYTHAYDGSLRFNACQFINCGQDPTLFKQRGQSACVKLSGSRDFGFAALKNLKAYFSDCIFESTGKYQVATFYSDLPYAQFLRCRWQGSVQGYSIVSPKLAEQTGKLVELKFIECDNPCYRIQSVNTIRRLIRCANVSNPFADAVELTDCEIIVGYADVENNYTAQFSVQYDTPVVCSGCKFNKGAEDIAIRNTITYPRPMVFDHCSWNFTPSQAKTHRGSYYIALSNPKGTGVSSKSVEFKSCEINIDKYRLLYCSDTDVRFDKCDYQMSYDTLVDGQAERPNRVRVSNMTNLRKREVARHSVFIK